ncbi:hypothetical protein SAMN05421593_3437 [Chryseobacterium culicis]|jgi:hypothetical protein|uniref:Uncharacterized protein n=1 Tax=Chryseobacterium culicis TaxID=680127 RepID=A0A1H6HTR2_CHRCI|nr:hypothetical protein SAMN05421593_3437 [Chryseobacterium culicis]
MLVKIYHNLLFFCDELRDNTSNNTHTLAL